MTNSEALISVKNLTKTYKMGDFEVHALRNISLDIVRGSFVAVMGPSGSGKSTFMNVLGCLDSPTTGEYYLDGVNVLALSKNELAALRNNKIGFIFQSFNILPRTSALENVELPLLYNGKINTHDRLKRASDALASVGLADRQHHMPSQLSGGQQQRVAIARALVNNPLIIMADEPTGNLDTRSSYEIMGIFQKLNDQGITILMVTHEPDIARFALSNIMFRDGKITSNEPVSEPKSAAKELAALPVVKQEDVLT